MNKKEIKNPFDKKIVEFLMETKEFIRNTEKIIKEAKEKNKKQEQL